MAMLPEACESKTKTQAAYRFMANADVHFQTVLQPHYAATERRAAELSEGSVILVPQDTTSLNYNAKKDSIGGLGPIGTRADGAQGVHLHSSLALTVTGIPLGFLDAKYWARDPADFGKNKNKRRDLPIEQKESYRWIESYQALAGVQQRNPHLSFVSVGDREADIYELFEEAAKTAGGPKLLVRAMHDRKLQGETTRLFDSIKAQEIAGRQIVRLPKQKNRAARDAVLTIRYAQKSVCPPNGKSGREPVIVWAVLAEEEDAPEGAEPIQWLLLTTVAVHNVEQAVERIAWYTQRWAIEVFHRTLKSGCNIEERRLGHADRLEVCLAIDMVIAWRIYHMVKLGREVPDVPCDVFLDDYEWKSLCIYSTKNKTPPTEPPTANEAVRMIAKIGGFLGRKSDGEPGTETIWRGLERLSGMADMWRIMTGGP